MPTDVRAESRRNFLRFLAESPLLYGLGGTLAATAARAQDDAVLSGALDFDGVITSAGRKPSTSGTSRPRSARA